MTRCARDMQRPDRRRRARHAGCCWPPRVREARPRVHRRRGRRRRRWRAVPRRGAGEVVITDWQMPGLDGTALARGDPERARGRLHVRDRAHRAAPARRPRATRWRRAPTTCCSSRSTRPTLERKLIAAERMTGDAPPLARRRAPGPAHRASATGCGWPRTSRRCAGASSATGTATASRSFDVDNFKAYNDALGHLAETTCCARSPARCATRSAAATRCTATAARSSWCCSPEQSLERAAVAAPSGCARPSRRSTCPIPDGGARHRQRRRRRARRRRPARPTQLFALADRRCTAPRRRAATGCEVGAAPRSSRASAGVRLLIADDDEAIRLTLGAMLATRHEALELVGEAADADEAVALARDDAAGRGRCSTSTCPAAGACAPRTGSARRCPTRGSSR